MGREEITLAQQSIAPVNLTAGSNDNVIVTGKSGQRIVVLYGWLSAGATATTYLMEGSGGTALTGVVTIPANQSHEFVPPQGIAVMKCLSGESLRIDVGGGDLDGWLVYAMVQAQ